MAATETWSFALAGGNALVAHGMLARPTQDVDLFTPTQGGPGQAVDVVTDSLRAAGLGVTVQHVVDVAHSFGGQRLAHAVVLAPVREQLGVQRVQR